MSFPVIVEKQNRAAVGQEARPFLGAPSLQAPPKRRPASLRLARGASAPYIRERGCPTRQHGVVRGIAKALLPHPRSSAPWDLWRAVSCDFFLVTLSFVIATRINLPPSLFQRAVPGGILNPRHSADTHLVLGFALLYGALVTLLSHSEGLYQQKATPVREEIGVVVKGVLWGSLLVSVAIWLCAPESQLLAALRVSAALNVGFLLGWRAWSRRSSAKEVARGKGTRNVLIVGSSAEGRELAEYFKANPQLKRVVKGVINERPSSLRGQVLGGIDALPEIAKAQFIEEIVVMPGCEEQTLRVIRLARQLRLNLLLVPNLFGFELQQPNMEWLGRLPAVVLHEERLPELALFVKRILDVLLSSLLLVILFPVIAAIAVAIKFDTRGPVLYCASRVGRKGQRFRCFKFRTMVVSADRLKETLRGLNQREGPCFKIAQDPRITCVGRFLRRYSLDEIPQLWNVLRGEMSLVGPRPHPLDDFSRYELDHLRRLNVTPGMTGLWQVTARQDSSFVAALALDLKYIEDWSLWLDLRILFRTLSAVLAGTGV